MVNRWFGARWFGILGIPFSKGYWITWGAIPRIPNHRAPNHQLTICWAFQELFQVSVRVDIQLCLVLSFGLPLVWMCIAIRMYHLSETCKGYIVSGSQNGGTETYKAVLRVRFPLNKPYPYSLHRILYLHLRYLKCLLYFDSNSAPILCNSNWLFVGHQKLGATPIGSHIGTA